MYQTGKSIVASAIAALAPAGPGIPAWQWGKTEQTQQALLAAACEVFAEQGYASAKMTEIAGRAGLSVGSIYHHFGGKSDLYLALWRRYHLAREEAAARAEVERIAREVLTNPVIEEFSFRLE